MAKKERKITNRAVEFLQPYSNKQKGDKASLPLVLAASLVNKGIAVYAEGEQPKAVVEPVKVEPKEEKKPKEKSKKQKKNEKDITGDSLM